MYNSQGIALTVGLCYLGTNANTQSGIQSVQGAIFIMVAENTFTPMYTVLDLFPQEQPLFLREYKSGLYPVWVYYTAKCFAIVSVIQFRFSVYFSWVNSLLRYSLAVNVHIISLK